MTYIRYTWSSTSLIYFNIYIFSHINQDNKIRMMNMLHFPEYNQDVDGNVLLTGIKALIKSIEVDTHIVSWNSKTFHFNNELNYLYEIPLSSNEGSYIVCKNLWFFLEKPWRTLPLLWKWPIIVFGPKTCTMLWNLLKNNFSFLFISFNSIRFRTLRNFWNQNPLFRGRGAYMLFSRTWPKR